MAESNIEDVTDFRSELRLSPIPAIVILFLAAVVIFTISGIPKSLEERLRLMLSAGIALVLAVAVLTLYRWRGWAGQWSSVAVIALEIHMSAYWLSAGGTMLLNTLPVALAGATISVPASVVIAAIQTSHHTLRPRFGLPESRRAGSLVGCVFLMGDSRCSICRLLSGKPCGEMGLGVFPKGTKSSRGSP